MNCERTRELFAEHWAGTLEGAERAQLESHLAGCARCREEAERLGALWERLGALPEEKPGAEARGRFYEMLEAYRQGLGHSGHKRWSPLRLALQLGAAAAMLVVGIAVGHQWKDGASPEVAQLRGEVSNMRQLVTLSLLQQQSASERLKGVTWSYRADESETEVLSALLRTVNQDPNVNVRLAAVDALKNFSDSPLVRRSLGRSLGQQTSPLVEIALIDLAVDLREKQALEALQRIRQDQGANPEVRERARLAIERLGRQ